MKTVEDVHGNLHIITPGDTELANALCNIVEYYVRHSAISEIEVRLSEYRTRAIAAALSEDFDVRGNAGDRGGGEGAVVTFAGWLKDQRAQRRLSQVKLAFLIGADKGYLSQVESGKRPPSDDLIARLASYFVVEQEMLMCIAEKFPADIIAILRDHPVDAPRMLRARFGVVAQP